MLWGCFWVEMWITIALLAVYHLNMKIEDVGPTRRMSEEKVSLGGFNVCLIDTRELAAEPWHASSVRYVTSLAETGNSAVQDHINVRLLDDHALH